MRGAGRGKIFEVLSEEYRRTRSTAQGGSSSPDATSSTSTDSALPESESRSDSPLSAPTPASTSLGNISSRERDRPIQAGRGRGLFRPPPSEAYVYQPPHSPSPLICGPLRPTESILIETSSSSSSSEKGDENLIDQIRLLNLGRGRGRGRGRGLFALSSDESETNFRSKPISIGIRNVSPLTSSPSALSPLPTTSSSASSSASESGSTSGSGSQRKAIVKRGEEGKIVPVAANYIWLHVDEHKGIFQYHVQFEPPIENPRLKKAMLKEHVGVLGTVRNFDGAKLFLPFKLPEKITHLHSFNPNEPTLRVDITIKLIQPSKSESYMRDYVQFCNILFRRIMGVLGLININRHFFNPELKAVHQLPQHRLEIWPGYVTAIDELEGGLLLCCDTSFRVLRTDTMLDVWNDIRCGRHSAQMSEDEAKGRYKDFLMNKIVLTRYNNRHYRIDDVDFTRNPMSTFDCRGEQITFADYYQRQYSLRLTDMKQPLLCHLPRAKKNDPRRGVLDPILLIPELCYITGLSEEITSNPRIMKDMSTFTRLTPQQRSMCLKKFIDNVNNNEQASQILRDWGLRLDDSSVKLEGRVIGQDLVVELNSKHTFTLKSVNYEFSREAKNNICYDSVAVNDWAVFFPVQEGKKVEGLRESYMSVCRKLGIQVSAAHFVPIHGRRNDDYRQTIARFLQSHPKLQFFILVMSRRQDDIYALMKKLSCVDKPIPSQGILVKSLSDPRKINSIMAKIALQINCKIGGSLWTIRMPRAEKIMFVGMDVYHDPKEKSSSVTALVASLNEMHTKYFSKIVRQRTHQETMSSLRPLFQQALKEFHYLNECWPDRILVYRDGIGDGELETTREFEVTQMTETTRSLCENAPKFTYTVVQKRIHTRIFTESKRERKYVNPEPGTVLDNTVTRKYFFDFFLVSQLISEGTATPTHYVVLEDNSNITPDLIQKFTFATSFMYYNWAGSIRVPAVCQYAHKLAYLVGQYLQCDPSDQLNKQLYYL